MNALLDVILPVFVVIGFGYAAAKAGLFSEATADGLMRFAQTFAVPCLLFRSIATLDLGTSFQAGLIASFYLGAFAGFGVGFAGARLIFGRPAADAVAIGFACLFSNSLLLGLPITERAYGAEALAGNFAIISIHAPLFYAFGITVMEVVRSQGSGLAPMRVMAQVVRTTFSNALVIGITAGLVVNLAGVPLPGSVMAGVDLLSQAAIPAALFGLGAVMVRYRAAGDAATIAMVCTISLVLHPAVTWALGRFVFGLDVAQMRSAVVTAAMAPGVNAYLFAALYGVAMRVAASSVLIATGLSIGTVWFWLRVLP